MSQQDIKLELMHSVRDAFTSPQAQVVYLSLMLAQLAKFVAEDVWTEASNVAKAHADLFKIPPTTKE